LSLIDEDHGRKWQGATVQKKRARSVFGGDHYLSKRGSLRHRRALRNSLVEEQKKTGLGPEAIKKRSLREPLRGGRGLYHQDAAGKRMGKRRERKKGTPHPTGGALKEPYSAKCSEKG